MCHFRSHSEFVFSREKPDEKCITISITLTVLVITVLVLLHHQLLGAALIDLTKIVVIAELSFLLITIIANA